MKLLTHAVLIGACLCASPSFAVQATDQQVQKLLQTMNIDEILQQTMRQIRPQLDQQAYEIVKHIVKSDQLSPQEQVVANELSDQMYAQSKKITAWNNLQPIYQKIYKDVYNAEEVQAQIDFYSSSIGQSILKKSPQIAQESMKIMNSQLTSIMHTSDQDLKQINQKIEALKKAVN